MKIYLDIDGVLLTKHGEPAIGVVNFLKEVTDKHNCYWLTTHCKDGTTDNLIHHLNKKLPDEAMQYLLKVKANTWDYLKTEGLDFSDEFIWLDDNLMYREKAVLRQQKALRSFRLVDLGKYPDQLLHELF